MMNHYDSRRGKPRLFLFERLTIETEKRMINFDGKHETAEKPCYAVKTVVRFEPYNVQSVVYQRLHVVQHTAC